METIRVLDYMGVGTEWNAVNMVRLMVFMTVIIMVAVVIPLIIYAFTEMEMFLDLVRYILFDFFAWMALVGFFPCHNMKEGGLMLIWAALAYVQGRLIKGYILSDIESRTFE